jgi:hypothetical protein
MRSSFQYDALDFKKCARHCDALVVSMQRLVFAAMRDGLVFK